MGLRSEQENLKGHISSLRGIIFVLILIIAGMWVTTLQLTKTQSVSIPPDLRSGAVVQLNTPHPANIFSFTAYIYQIINDWPTDGAKEYSKNIYKLQSYFTKTFMATILNDIKDKGRKGELDGRTRGTRLLAGYDEQHVDVISDKSWVVWLDIELTEHVKGLKIKKLEIRYPIKVVKTDASDANPWGLLLDGYSQPPFEINKTAQ